ncbi:MAG TPA: flagellar hook capping FlgD N-terminal domain-containing protein [Candidatus Limnocylindrales bacterium]
MTNSTQALAASSGLLGDSPSGYLADGVGGLPGTSLAKSKDTSSVYGLGKDDFMKLFLAQLANQDPTNPVNDKDFLAQLAQFSLIDTMNQVKTALSGTQLAQASSLIGKHVQGTDVNGTAVNGTVDKLIQSADAGLVLIIGSQAVKPDAVTVVEDASSATAAASSAASA